MTSGESAMGAMIEIDALDGEGRFAAYRAAPEGPAKAAIIVVQEIFGINAGIRAKCDGWAAAGYLALAPDMFWRFAPGYAVDPDVPEQMADAFEVRKQFDLSLSASDIEAVIRVARGETSGGKVGVVGYCMGGSVAYLAAARTDVDASVGYYGAQIPNNLGEAHGIARPLLLHFAEEDDFIPADAIAKVRETLTPLGHTTILTYPGTGHGFADTFGKRRVEHQAEVADARTAAFFAEHLA